ncbi:thioredoxin domain-containing protein [Collibacillus ludicampi]|uniref:Thioredoxin domain-containing protein n=1 Tax=Collibacillus ludicampi TaxID=2771369 RepID=A0AAV4LBD4_9BACL|nr:thioredoxin domain-containing protein [Collibacillus ludicampi]GIM45115.1 thioredoxin domain-containing protein [Collibacillus ludicampi]
MGAPNQGKKPNRLIHEKSPYLLQHAYNPVDWFPWSQEAFEKAKRENKPIFLSVGYSTCHWCHVMERESFEDEEVAELLNRHFVAIKVDREERPDVDHIYMTVCQAMTGHGGWPLTVFLTPEKKPFFAGTYFPKHGRYGHSGLIEILTQIAKLWKEDRERLIRSSERLTEALQPRFGASNEGKLSEEILHQAFQMFCDHFDTRYGGFSDAPKFPTPHNLTFLLRYWKQTGKTKALAMVEKTLEAMHRGGIYDHLGYGFARYSTDDKWLVPHFEKMLYDNALLAIAYLEAFQVTGKETYARIAREIFTYILRDMTSPDGGFYSAEDADSEGVEGKFYVFTPAEIKHVLGEKEGTLFCRYYDVTEKGNFEGTSILNIIHTDPVSIVREAGLSVEQLESQMEGFRQKLFAYREKRIHPHKDDKILTAWNGLMIAALAKGAQILQDPSYEEAAKRAVSFIQKHLVRDDGRLLARYRDGEAAFLAYLDDYAFLTWGLLELYEASFSAEYLGLAKHYTEEMVRLFWDDREGGFYLNGSDAEQLLARPKEVYDGALPSGNSVAALNLLRLARITGETRLEELAQKQIQAFSGNVGSYPPGYTHFLMALQFAYYPGKEIVVAGSRDAEDTKRMLRAVHQVFLPQAVRLFRPEGPEAREIERLVPFIKEQKAIEGRATAFVCENYACKSPTTDVEQFMTLLQSESKEK